MKERILAAIQTAVIKFLYYDRKEDEDLPVGVIEQAVRDGVITTDEIVEEFRHEIERSI